MLLSPELALVDPELAAAARALLPERRFATPATIAHVQRQQRLRRAPRREPAIAAVGLLVGAALAIGIARLDVRAPRPPIGISAAASPAKRVEQRAPVSIRWAVTQETPYFDFVLWRDGRRVFDAWPTTPTTVIPATWIYRGTRYQLTRGRYAWFVYPGVGHRSDARYGALSASGQFVVVDR